MNRAARAQLARDTLSILAAGHYSVPDKGSVSIRDDLAAACANTVLYRPADYAGLVDRVKPLPGAMAPIVRVSDRTTLAAARELAASYTAVGCLNFASAKHPGGGFLSGSQAQEESLARASGLYATLQTQPAFYDYHRGGMSALYSDHVIFSPRVPVFRDDDGRLLTTPWQATVLTAAAVNAGAVRRNHPTQMAMIVPVMERRTRMVLAVAALHRCEALVLGAWGCGVFGNEPATIAAIFARVLAEPPFLDLFRHIEFAVYDPAPEQATLRAFEHALQP